MSEFTAFLYLIFQFVKFIIDCTTLCIALCLLAIACVLPWRWSTICNAARRGDEEDFRFWCLVEFLCTLLDFFAVPAGLLAACIPTRTRAYIEDTLDMVADTRRASPASGKTEYNAELRFMWLGLLWQGFWDIVILCICAPSLVVPTRLYAFVRNFWYAGATYFRYGSWKTSCPCCLGEDDGSIPFKMNRVGGLRGSWLLSLPLAVVEVLGFLCGTLALLSGIRTAQTWREARVAIRERPIFAGGEFTGHRFHAIMCFNWQLQKALITNGVTLAVDIVFCPLLFLLLVTVVRLRPACKAIRKRVDWTARRIILRQACRLVADVVMAVPLAIVLITWYRRAPVFAVWFPRTPAGLDAADSAEAGLAPTEVQVLQDEDLQASGGPRTPNATEARERAHAAAIADEKDMRIVLPIHAAIFEAFGLLVLDAICLPMLILMTYRLPNITGQPFSHGRVFEQFGELLIDLPFLLGGAVVLVTLYRADLVLPLLRSTAGSAARRRKIAGTQFLRLLRDVAMFIPLTLVIVTFYRIPTLIMNLKARMSRMLLEDAEMQTLSMRLIAPRPVGRPGFVLRCAKPPNLSGLTSMHMQVSGDEFWQQVANQQGQMVATAARAMLPYALRNGRETDLSFLERGKTEVEISVEFQCNVKATTLLGFLRKLTPGTGIMLQLEGKLDTGRRVVLAVVPGTVDELMASLGTADGTVACEFFPPGGLPSQLEEEEADALAVRVAELRGADASQLKRDSWWSAVLGEAVQVIGDAIILFTAMLLLLFPWRFCMAFAQCFCEPAKQRSARLAKRTIRALDLWDKECDSLAKRLGPYTNSYAKEAANRSLGKQRIEDVAFGLNRVRDKNHELISCMEGFIGCICCVFFPCCPNYSDFDFEDGVRERYYERKGRDPNSVIARNLTALGTGITILREQLKFARKRWPADEEWEPLDKLVSDQLRCRSEMFYWLLLLPEIHLRFAKKLLSDEAHLRWTQRVRAQVFQQKREMEERHTQLEQQFKERCAEAKKSNRGRVKVKGKCFAILREQLVKGVTDVLSVPALLLLFVSFYRVPALFAKLRLAIDMAHVKAIVKCEVAGFAMDCFRFMQTMILTIVLIGTVVKLPDYLGGLWMCRDLKGVRDWALSKVAELVVGILELLLLLTAFKTFRLLVSACVFAVLSPAAMLAVAAPKVCGRTCRFILTSLVWLGVLSTVIYAPPFVQALVLGIVLVAAFGGFAVNGVRGWTKPMGGTDWWSPAARPTFPNLIAALVPVGETIGLYLAAAWQPALHGGVGPLHEQSPAVGIALFAVAASAVLMTAPIVAAGEEEQREIVRDSAWRCATAVLHEVAFLLVVLALTAAAPTSYVSRIALLYFVTVSLLTNGVWETTVERDDLLDIRSVGLNACGRQLLLAAAVVAASAGQAAAAAGLGAAAALWALLWAWRGSSVLWVEILRVGGVLGAVVAICYGVQDFDGRLQVAACIWGGSVFLALLWSAGAHAWRRRELKRSGIPQAMQSLQRIQATLSLWGDAQSEPFRLSLSVQGAALQVLQLEENLPFERLKRAFLGTRSEWRKKLLDAPDFPSVLKQLQELTEALDVPISRVLLRQTLSKVPLQSRGTAPFPAPLIAEIISFASPNMLVASPNMPHGWQQGKIHLAGLREQAKRAAENLPVELWAPPAKAAPECPKPARWAMEMDVPPSARRRAQEDDEPLIVHEVV